MALSVIIITKNEEHHIAECLASVSFADEVIVLDSGSTDRTCEIAREFGAVVQSTSDWPGFGPQKNRALDLATGDWVLSVDADERVTPELAGCITQAMDSPKYSAYKIARLSNFCGRWIRHSGWWPDHVVRLFRRGTARFSDAAIHEKVLPDGPVGVLNAHFLHYPYANLDALVAKVNRYSTDAALMMHARGKRTHLSAVIGHSVWTFIRIYIVRRGFLDGREGFVLAAVAAAGSFFRYSKLMYLSQSATKSENTRR
jgi:glycosyltransferase involved in cell wall biosynthesis